MYPLYGKEMRSRGRHVRIVNKVLSYAGKLVGPNRREMRFLFSSFRAIVTDTPLGENLSF
jgi:hypothetical protein